MGETQQLMKTAIKQPWFYSVALLSITPLFPDYCCFILTIAAFVLALVDAKQRGVRISLGRLGWFVLAYLGYMAFSVLYSSARANSFWSTVMWGCMFLGYVSFTTVLYERRRLRAAVLCMTTATGVVGTVTVFQYIMRECLMINVSDKLWNGLDRWAYGLLGIPLSQVDLGERVSGTFNNPNLLAAYLVMTIPFSIAFVMTGTRSKPKALARISLILAAYALGFSFCRGAYLALIAIGGLLVIMFIRKKFVMTVLAIIYVCLLIPPSISGRLVSVIPSAPDQPADSVELKEDENILEHITNDAAAKYEQDSSVSMRFVMWKEVLVSGVKRPIFGAGFGIGSTQQILDAAQLDFKHAHNLFLELFSEGGILSLAFFLTIMVVLCMRGLRLMLLCKHNESLLLGFAIIAACAALCILGVFDFPLLTPRPILTCMLLIGITESATRVYLKPSAPQLCAPAEKRGVFI